MRRACATRRLRFLHARIAPRHWFSVPAHSRRARPPSSLARTETVAELAIRACVRSTRTHGDVIELAIRTPAALRDRARSRCPPALSARVIRLLLLREECACAAALAPTAALARSRVARLDPSRQPRRQASI